MGKTEDVPLTYEYLASFAVTPANDHHDLSGEEEAMDGAYMHSKLNDRIGLHIHQPNDRWDETEPEKPVHFCAGGAKVAMIYPVGVIFEESDWRFSSWIDSWKKSWLERLAEANDTITFSWLADWRVNPAIGKPDIIRPKRTHKNMLRVENAERAYRDSTGRFAKRPAPVMGSLYSPGEPFPWPEESTPLTYYVPEPAAETYFTSTASMNGYSNNVVWYNEA